MLVGVRDARSFQTVRFSRFFVIFLMGNIIYTAFFVFGEREECLHAIAISYIYRALEGVSFFMKVSFVFFGGICVSFFPSCCSFCGLKHGMAWHVTVYDTVPIRYTCMMIRILTRTEDVYFSASTIDYPVTLN